MLAIKGAIVPRDGRHGLAKTTTPRLAKSAQYRRPHIKAHRQENRANIRRDTLLHHLFAC